MMGDDIDLNNSHDYVAVPASRFLSFIRNRRIRIRRFMKTMERIKQKRALL